MSSKKSFTDHLRNALETQPTKVSCSKCNNTLRHKTTVINSYEIQINVQPCMNCTAKKRKAKTSKEKTVACPACNGRGIGEGSQSIATCWMCEGEKVVSVKHPELPGYITGEILGLGVPCNCRNKEGKRELSGHLRTCSVDMEVSKILKRIGAI